MSTALPNQPLPMIHTLDVERTRALGALTVIRESAKLELPLAGVEIAAHVADRVAGVTVTETFRNPYPESLEAVYVFPLAGGSAVSAFEMRVGDRTVRGIVKERGEARRDYAEALEAGKRAALLEQERDDVFTVQVGNLPPGEEVTVRVTYSERLPFFDDGTTELRLPLVVAPRYIAGSPIDRGAAGLGTADDTDVVPDASRITPPRLAGGADPKVALGIDVELALDGASASDLACSQHATRTAFGPEGVRVSLAREGERLDRDFVLRWRLAGESVRTSFLRYAAPARAETGDRVPAPHEGQKAPGALDAFGGAYGMVTIVPPRRDGFLGTPRDVVFVVDRSGSMGGTKMVSAARACSILLGTLGPRDRFAVQAFDDRVEWMTAPGGMEGRFARADEAGREAGEAYLRGIEARGGTELDGAVGGAIRAIAERAETSGRAPVIVVLTDGEIGDESRVLKRIQSELGDARVFTVGIDTAVNDGFLRRLASLGGGTATFVEPGLQLEDALRSVGREIGTPLVVDVRIEDVDAGLDARSLAPARVPDLFAGRATTAFVRLAPGSRGARLRVRGRFEDGGEFDETVEARDVALPAIGHLWARARVADLEDAFRLGPSDAIKQQIVDISVAHTLLTRFTAFVAVDESEVVNPDGTRRTVVQPVAMPDQWEAPDLSSTLAGGAALPSMMAPMPTMAPPPPGAPSPVMYSRSMAPQQPTAGSPPPPLKGRVGGIAGALGQLFKRAAAPPAAESAGAPAQPSAAPAQRSGGSSGAGTAASAAERAEIESATRALVDAVEAARAAIASGSVPKADSLKGARAALLALLSRSEVGQHLPALQRFLRSSALEMIAALEAPGAKAPDVLAVFARHAKALDAAKAEVAALRSAGSAAGGESGGSPDAGAFWEGSI